MGVDSEHAFRHWDGDMSSLGTGDLINGVALSSTLHTDMVRLVGMGTVRFSKCLTKGQPPQCLLHLDSSLHRGTHSSSAAETSCIAPWLSILAGVCYTGRLLESVELHMFQGIYGMCLTEFEWFGWLRSVVLELMQHHQQPLAPPVPWVAMVSSLFFEDLTEMRMHGGWVQSWYVWIFWREIGRNPSTNDIDNVYLYEFWRTMLEWSRLVQSSLLNVQIVYSCGV